MELSLEIPCPHIDEFLPLLDFPFGLAQLCLPSNLRVGTEFSRHKEYAEQMQGCLLDNGMYEVGEPLKIEELLEAAAACNPIAVIAPDWKDDADRSYKAAVQLLDARPSDAKWSVGAVVQGKDLTKRMACFYDMQLVGFSPICFPFRTPRQTTINTISGFKDEGWYHLLGLNAVSELCWGHIDVIPVGRWSIDTGKPFKGFNMSRMANIRGHGKLNMHKELSEQTKYWALWNIAWMRRLMR